MFPVEEKGGQQVEEGREGRRGNAERVKRLTYPFTKGIHPIF